VSDAKRCLMEDDVGLGDKRGDAFAVADVALDQREIRMP
jgi:hypothetical protein